MARLDLGASFSGAVCLVEWAGRLQQQAPAERLDLSIAILSQASGAAGGCCRAAMQCPRCQAADLAAIAFGSARSKTSFGFTDFADCGSHSGQHAASWLPGC
jgi:hypothetical protein